MSLRRSPKSQDGMSLIELVISVTVAAALIFGMIKLFMGKEPINKEEVLARMQEDANYALDILVKDIRISGYLGCSNLRRITPNIVSATPAIGPYSLNTAFTGHQNTGAQTWAPALPPEVSTASDNSDVMTVKSAGRCAAALSEDMINPNSNLTITNTTCGFGKDDVVIISDCSKADVFRVTNIPGETAQLAHDNFSNIYTAQMAQVLSFASTSYFVQIDQGNQQPTLFALDNTKPTGENNPVALMNGVENMQVEYGIDSNNDREPDRFNNANRINDWGQVIAARITLLLRSPEDMGEAPYVFNLGGNRVTYSGGQLRKEYSSTVKLRHR